MNEGKGWRGDGEAEGPRAAGPPGGPAEPGATGGPGGAAASIVEGIRMPHRQILDLLANMGVRLLDPAGRLFDARYHEAVEVVAPTEHPTGTVVAEVQRGYLIGDEVLRPARVRVAREA